MWSLQHSSAEEGVGQCQLRLAAALKELTKGEFPAACNFGFAELDAGVV